MKNKKYSIGDLRNILIYLYTEYFDKLTISDRKLLKSSIEIACELEGLNEKKGIEKRNLIAELSMKLIRFFSQPSIINIINDFLQSIKNRLL